MRPIIRYSQSAVWTTGLFPSDAASHATSAPTALCPDLLVAEQIGAADGARGRVVRGFFFALRLWPPGAGKSRPR